MITNAILARWSGGWAEIFAPDSIAVHGRKEGHLALGAVQSRDELSSVCGQQLLNFADPRTEIAADLANTGDSDTPFVAFGIGDRVTVPDIPGHAPALERVTSITVAMDENGQVTYAPTLRDTLLDERERFSETLTKLASGSLGGESKVATPATYVPSIGNIPLSPATAPSGFQQPAMAIVLGTYSTTDAPEEGAQWLVEWEWAFDWTTATAEGFFSRTMAGINIHREGQYLVCVQVRATTQQPLLVYVDEYTPEFGGSHRLLTAAAASPPYNASGAYSVRDYSVSRIDVLGGGTEPSVLSVRIVGFEPAGTSAGSVIQELLLQVAYVGDAIESESPT